MVEPRKTPTDLSLGNEKANCKVSFYTNDDGTQMMKVSEINGIMENGVSVFAGMHPQEMEIPLPLCEDRTLVWHNIEGIEALEITGGFAPTFIPCACDQLEQVCAHLGKGVPNTPA